MAVKTTGETWRKHEAYTMKPLSGKQYKNKKPKQTRDSYLFSIA